MVNKLVNKDGDKAADKMAGILAAREVKKGLEKTDHNTCSNSDDWYRSGQIDACLRMVADGKIGFSDAAEITGKNKQELLNYYRKWGWALVLHD